MKTEYSHIMGTGIFLIILIIVSGCATQPAPGQQKNETLPSYVLECIKSCNNTKNVGENLELGPCLLDPIPYEPDWVCDVSHSPRQDVDNNPHNQCQSYLRGQAHHFVEVTPECGLIRAV